MCLVGLSGHGGKGNVGGAPEHVHDDVSFFHFLTSFIKRATACSGFVDLENYPRDS